MIVTWLPLLILLDTIAWAIGLSAGVWLGMWHYRMVQRDRQRELRWID